MNSDEQRFVTFWADRLPPVIARKHVDWFLGGIVSPSALSLADSQGNGPDSPIKIGKCVAYHTRELLTWLIETRGLKKMQNLNNIKGRSRPQARRAI